MAAQISNLPSFNLQRQPSEKLGRLQLLCNLIPGEQPARHIVLAVSLTPESAAALTWAIQNLCRSGDAVHLVHVVTCLSTATEVYHSGPGNAYHVEDEGPHHERQDVLKAQADIKDRLLPLLKAARLLYEVHMFVDTWNAPPDAVGTTWLRLAADVKAAAVVMSANDQASADPQHLGSVAQWVVSQQQQPVPVVLVRNWQLQPEGAGQQLTAVDEASPTAAEMAAAARASARAEEAQQGEVVSAAAAAADLMAATASSSDRQTAK